MNQRSDSLTNRRDFIKTSSGVIVAASALASTVSFPHVSIGQPKGDKLKIGWVGCGGRGTGAAYQALNADSNVELWATGDAFKENMEKSLVTLKTGLKDKADRINLTEERKFVGIDAFQKVIDSGVDVVILTSPPGFRPSHIAAAVKAGKHIFTEKPMAVDGAGLRSVMASAEEAKKKKLAMVDGFVWRWTYANPKFTRRFTTAPSVTFWPFTPLTTRQARTVIRTSPVRTRRTKSNTRCAVGTITGGSPVTASWNRRSIASTRCSGR